jgi:putative spermidine/putrescine transport system permease protein
MATAIAISRTAVTAHWPLLPGLALLILLFLVPLLLMIPASLTVDGQASLRIYEQVLGDSYYWMVFGRSFTLAFISTAFCLILGYPVAYYIARVVRPSRRRFVFMIVVAPLFTSAVIRAMAWTIVLGRRGLLNEFMLNFGILADPLRLLYTQTAVVIGLVYIMIPFMVLTITAVLDNIDPKLEEAARDLGATPMNTFLRVTLPLSLPGVIAGCFLVFALCLTSYVTPALLGGGRNKVMSMLIFEQFMRTFNWALGAGLACVLLAITLVIIWGYNRMLSHRVRGSHGNTGGPL